MLCFAIALLGAALVRELPDEMRWGRYVGTILVGGYSRCFPLIMSLLSSNVSRFTKKTTVNALVWPSYSPVSDLTLLIFSFLDIHRLLRWKYHRPPTLLR